MRQGSAKIPKDMPCQLWYIDAMGKHTINIRSWQVNAQNGPSAEDFRRPEKLDGWKVVTWPPVVAE